MKKENIINIKVRMNLDREEDRKAWENLRGIDRKKYKSYSRAFIKAINYFTDIEHGMSDDLRKERRKEQEELLKLITKTVDSSVCNALGPIATIPRSQENVTVKKRMSDTSDKDHEDVSSQEKTALLDEALDFANGF